MMLEQLDIHSKGEQKRKERKERTKGGRKGEKQTNKHLT